MRSQWISWYKTDFRETSCMTDPGAVKSNPKQNYGIADMTPMEYYIQGNAINPAYFKILERIIQNKETTN